MDTKLYSLYNIPTSVPIIKARQNLIEEVQTYLLHLHLLPYNSQIDGVFSSATMASLLVTLPIYIPNFVRNFKNMRVVKRY